MMFLIERNLSDDGHLSNTQGAELVAAVLLRSRRQSPRHVVLLHLSEQCNQPDLAVRAAEDALRTVGRKADVHAARQCPAFPNLLVSPSRRPNRACGTSVTGRPAPPTERPARTDASRGEPGLLRWGPDQD